MDQMDEVLENAVSLDDIQEYLIFSVDSIDFGIDIGLVQEIIKIQPISAIPNALPFCRGIINIRGTVVPVIDMRLKLGFEAAEYNERTCIVVVKLDTTELIGVIVDMVQDVMRIGEDGLSEAPAAGQNQIRYTAQIACVGERIMQILDIDAVFGTGEEQQ